MSWPVGSGIKGTVDVPSYVRMSDVNLDAFNRLKVSNPISLINAKHTHDDQPLLFFTELTGGGTATHNKPHACMDLTVSSAGDKVVRESRQLIPYSAGQSQLGLFTFVFGDPEPGVRKRLGYFHDNDGIYFEQSEAGEYFLVLRSSVTGVVVEDRVPQSEWSEYTFDGGAPFYLTGDPASAQILVMDLQWLGVGRVRVGFEIDGSFVPANSWMNANTGKSTVYMQSASLPIRYEIEAVSEPAKPATLEQICATVIREGSEKEPARSTGVDRGISTISVTTGGRRAILGLRVKPDFITASIEDIVAGILPVDVTNDEVFWELLLDPTFSAGEAAWDANWVDAPSSAAYVQRNVPTTAMGVTVTAGSGYVMASGYASAGRQGGSAQSHEGENLACTRRDRTTPQELVLTVNPIAGTQNVVGNMFFREQI